MIGVGKIDADSAVQASFSGPMLRSTGLAIDLRKNAPYEIYDEIDFISPLTLRGDSYDRYLIRMEEMKSSNDLILTCLNRLTPGKVSAFEKPTSQENNYMELIIKHFKYYFEGVKPASGFTYLATEAPKGEFGV